MCIRQFPQDRNNNPLAFNQCPNLKKLQLPSKNKTFKIKGKCLIARKNNALVFAAAGGKALKIPNGVKTVKQNACNNVTAPIVHLPASVQKLEEDALTGADIKDVTVAAGNPVFQKDGPCIYRKKDKCLAVVIVDENRNVRISDNVEKITTPYSMVNYYNWYYDDLQTTVFPKNLKLLKYPVYSKAAGAKTSEPDRRRNELILPGIKQRNPLK